MGEDPCCPAKLTLGRCQKNIVTHVCNLQTIVGVELRPVIRPDGLVFHRNVNEVKKVLCDAIKITFQRDETVT
jgi:hypothetical protein